jgi:arylsulfatase A-like enzyme
MRIPCLTKKALRRRALAGVALFLSLGVAAAAESGPPRPNIILIMADDLGFSDIGCYGGEIATPNLDALAGNGVRYKQFYNAARCCPTRAALLTGLYPHQAGVGHMVDSYADARRAEFASSAYRDHLSAEAPTIAEVLRPAGYRTFMTGKWHLGFRPAEWPVQRGFDRSLVVISGAMNYFGHGAQHTSPLGQRGHQPMALDAEEFTPPQDGFFTTDAFTDYAIRFIAEPRAENTPFFLYLAYNAPHWPLQARPETIAKYRGKYKASGWDKLRAERHARLQQSGAIDKQWRLAPRPASLPAWEDLSAEKQDTWDEWMAVYAAQVEEMDAAIGRLMEALDKSGQADNTLVMFFSDNGGAAERPVKTMPGAPLGSRDSYEGYAVDGAHLSSAPFRKTKKFTHEGGVSSPLVVSWPAGIPAAQRGSWASAPGHVIDLMPTCLELAGATFPARWREQPTAPVQGVSLVPSLRGLPMARTAPLFWEHEGHRAVRDGNWKLVASNNQPWELYDLAAERTEMNDLAAQHPEIVTRLAEAYGGWAKAVGVKPWDPEKPGEQADKPRRKK